MLEDINMFWPSKDCLSSDYLLFRQMIRFSHVVVYSIPPQSLGAQSSFSGGMKLNIENDTSTPRNQNR